MSLVNISRMSSTPWRMSARRSMPKPKANPDHSSGSSPTLREHVGVHHAAAAQLEPAGLGAGATARALAEEQLMSNSADGSVNGKYDGPQPRVDRPAEVGRGERLERAGQVGEGDAPVDDQALDLVEHRHVAWRRRCRGGTPGPA